MQRPGGFWKPLSSCVRVCIMKRSVLRVAPVNLPEACDGLLVVFTLASEINTGDLCVCLRLLITNVRDGVSNFFL